MSAMPPLGGMLRAYFAAAAARERDARAKAYPKWVDDGKIEAGHAQADLAAWRAIAELFVAGSTETGLTWGELEHAAREALQRREEALAAKPADQDLLARRDAVHGIYERLSWHRRTIMRINDARIKQPQRAAA